MSLIKITIKIKALIFSRSQIYEIVSPKQSIPHERRIRLFVQLQNIGSSGARRAKKLFLRGVILATIQSDSQFEYFTALYRRVPPSKNTASYRSNSTSFSADAPPFSFQFLPIALMLAWKSHVQLPRPGILSRTFIRYLSALCINSVFLRLWWPLARHRRAFLPNTYEHITFENIAPMHELFIDWKAISKSRV